MTTIAYALPATLALLAKIGLFFYARRSRIHNLQTQLYLCFLFSLSIQNVAELTFFAAKAEGLPAPAGGTVYFAASIAAIAILLHLALALSITNSSRQDRLPRWILSAVYGPAVALEALLWLTPLLVAGFKPLNYTYTKIPGSLYFLFETYTIAYLLAVVGFLIYGAVKRSSAFRQLQNKILLLGLTPIVALVVAIVILQHVGFRGFNTTATLPVAVSFFLAVTAYATHQRRLFDIEFFIPWSKLRKRKTAFYRRIQALVGEIAAMESVQKIVQSISETLYCPVALLSGPKPALAMAGEAFGIARFPLEELRKIDHIVVANEIAVAIPGTYALMKRHKVAAIVPFHPHSQTAASWMLLGDAFSEHIYSPLDFKKVETLFARLADHFLDSQLLLRSQVAELRREMDALHERLANAWDQIEALRGQLALTEEENRALQEKNRNVFQAQMSATSLEALRSAKIERRPLCDYVAEFEARLIAETLEHCDDDVSRAADLLDMTPANLYYKLRQHRLLNR